MLFLPPNRNCYLKHTSFLYHYTCQDIMCNQKAQTNSSRRLRDNHPISMPSVLWRHWLYSTQCICGNSMPQMIQTRLLEFWQPRKAGLNKHMSDLTEKTTDLGGISSPRLRHCRLVINRGWSQIFLRTVSATSGDRVEFNSCIHAQDNFNLNGSPLIRLEQTHFPILIPVLFIAFSADKSRLDAFFQKGKTTWSLPFWFFISQLIDRHTHTQTFNGLWSGTTRVGQYQKKHSLTHTHPDQRTSFIDFLHLLQSKHPLCNSTTEQIANYLNKFSSIITVLPFFFQGLAFLIPGIHLDPKDISFPCPN